jgi:hypothetical protein
VNTVPLSFSQVQNGRMKSFDRAKSQHAGDGIPTWEHIRWRTPRTPPPLPTKSIVADLTGEVHPAEARY